jgi:hypothetical protein
MMFSFVILNGCTSIRINPIPANTDIRHICIQDNPRVKVDDFKATLREGFESHGISTEVFSQSLQESCEYSATYTALRSWDIVPYLSSATIEIFRKGRSIPIASANYHLKGRGGVAPVKFSGTRSKILPLFDKLLEQVNHPVTVYSTPISNPDKVTQPATAAPSSVEPPMKNIADKLNELKEAYDQGLITKDEFDAKRTELLNQL